MSSHKLRKPGDFWPTFINWEPRTFTLTHQQLARLDSGLCIRCGSNQLQQTNEGAHCQSCGVIFVLRDSEPN